MPSLKSLKSSKSAITLFEVRLENDTLTLQGPPDLAPKKIVRGSVVLCLSAPLKLEAISLEFKGEAQIDVWDEKQTPNTPPRRSPDCRPHPILSHRWSNLLSSAASSLSLTSQTPATTTLLPSGNYTYPFSLSIPGNVPETIQGLQSSDGVYISYAFTAAIHRPRRQAPICTAKPLRITRHKRRVSYDSDEAEDDALSAVEALSSGCEGVSMEGTWTSKLCSYSFTLPRKRVAFGTELPVEIEIRGLDKGVRVVGVAVGIVESCTWRSKPASSETESEEAEDRMQGVVRKVRPVARWDVPRSEKNSSTETESEDFSLATHLPLPRRLGRHLTGISGPVQDVDLSLPSSSTADHDHTGGRNVHLKISHAVTFVVSLHNPGGHVSELRTQLPLEIYLSSHMPLTSNGEVAREADPLSAASSRRGSISFAPPPPYSPRRTTQDWEMLERVQELRREAVLEVVERLTKVPSYGTAIRVPVTDSGVSLGLPRYGDVVGGGGGGGGRVAVR